MSHSLRTRLWISPLLERRALIFAAIASCGSLGRAQVEEPAVTIGLRSIADLGHYEPAAGEQNGVGYRVFETAVATNAGYALAVHISSMPEIATSGDAFVPHTTASGTRIRYAIWDGESSSWFADWLRPFDFADSVAMEDPCVLRGPGENDFVVVAKTSNKIVQSTIDASTGLTSPWETVYTGTPVVDKPWMARTDGGAYFLGFRDGFASLRFFRASNVLADDGVFGANDWSGGTLTIDGGSGSGGNSPYVTTALGNVFLPVRGGQTFNIARLTSTTANTFELLRESASTPVSLTLPSVAENCIPVPYPGATCPNVDLLRSGAVPTLVADPSEANRIYLFIHILSSDGGIPGEAEDSSDMDVQCARIVRGLDDAMSGQQRWSIDALTRLPHPATPSGTHPDAPSAGVYPDQFCLTAGADRFGRVHVLYYSNELGCGITSSEDAYDVWYAVADGDDLKFTPYRLRTCTQRPALDFGVPGVPSNCSVREYVGMAIDDSDEEFTFVTVTYSGTARGDTVSIDPTAIFGQTIRVRN